MGHMKGRSEYNYKGALTKVGPMENSNRCKKVSGRRRGLGHQGGEATAGLSVLTLRGLQGREAAKGGIRRKVASFPSPASSASPCDGRLPVRPVVSSLMVLVIYQEHRYGGSHSSPVQLGGR